LVREIAGRRSPLSGLLQAELGNLLYEKNEMVRVGHFIELGFSMTVVGIFMVWLFLKEKKGLID